MQLPDVCCACRNMCINGERVTKCNNKPIMHSCSKHCRLDFESNSNSVYQIHAGSIRLFNISMVAVRPIAPKEIELTCLECNKKFIIYASRRGAFCQKAKDDINNNSSSNGGKRSHSFSSEGEDTSIYSELVPVSMRQLFRRAAEHFEPFEAAASDGDDFIAANVDFLAGENVNCNNNNNCVLEPEEDTDYDIMFSNDSDRIVGCYTGMGRFATDASYLNFAD